MVKTTVKEHRSRVSLGLKVVIRKGVRLISKLRKALGLELVLIVVSKVM